MTAPEVELRAAWTRLSGTDRRHDQAIDGLLARLREPHRRYHTATHVMWVLRHVEEILAHPGCAGLDADAVRLAALWHDAVYDPHAADNEAVSARLAHEVAAGLGWTAARAELVERLVLATAPGAGTDTAAAPRADDHLGIDEFDVLHDADLAVLGGEPSEYRAYVAAVRNEYAHVDDESWRVGRSQVLRLLLDAPLYRTPVMAARTARARANLTAELAALDT